MTHYHDHDTKHDKVAQPVELFPHNRNSLYLRFTDFTLTWRIFSRASPLHILHRSMPNQLDGSHPRWAKAARGALSFDSGEVQSPHDVQIDWTSKSSYEITMITLLNP